MADSSTPRFGVGDRIRCASRGGEVATILLTVGDHRKVQFAHGETDIVPVDDLTLVGRDVYLDAEDVKALEGVLSYGGPYVAPKARDRIRSLIARAKGETTR